MIKYAQRLVETPAYGQGDGEASLGAPVQGILLDDLLYVGERFITPAERTLESHQFQSDCGITWPQGKRPIERGLGGSPIPVVRLLDPRERHVPFCQIRVQLERTQRATPSLFEARREVRVDKASDIGLRLRLSGPGQRQVWVLLQGSLKITERALMPLQITPVGLVMTLQVVVVGASCVVRDRLLNLGAVAELGNAHRLCNFARDFVLHGKDIFQRTVIGL